MRHALCALGLVAAAAVLAGCRPCGAGDARELIARYRQRRGPVRLATVSAPNRTDAANDAANWWAMAEPQPADPQPNRDRAVADPATGPAHVQDEDGSPQRRGRRTDDQPYEHWRTRVGPAYPDRPWRSAWIDLKELPATVWDDAKATVRDPFSVGMLTAAGIAGIALSGECANDDIERHFESVDGLNTDWDSVGGFFGSPAVHFPVAGLLYGASLARGDTETYRKSKTLINALALNGIVTQGLKWAAHTEAPNGDENGWPSGHTSSSFTLATWAWGEYGPALGAPLYAFAAFVGYERLDARNHDFSDVISGAMIGIAIGHAVVKNHRPQVLGMDLMPYLHPEGGAGLALHKRW